MWDRRRTLIFAICCSSLFVVGLDNTIANIALPAISKDLNASPSGLQWTVDAYAIVLASLLMLGGSTGDRLAGAASSRPAWSCSRWARCCAGWPPGWAG